MPKPDITSRTDIEWIVQEFYKRVLDDETLSIFFGAVQWEEHLELMYNFWEAMLFQTQKHRGDLMARHVQIDQHLKMEKEHFDRWVNLFCATVDDRFEGEKALLACNYAQNISTMMQGAIRQQRNSLWNKLR